MMGKVGTIYLATCRTTGDGYIGQTWHWPNRKRTHLKAAGIGSNGSPYFYNAIRKYGADDFEWSVLYSRECDQETLDLIETLEIEFHGTLHPNGYNLRTGGAGGLLCEDAKRRIGLAHKGRVVSEETREKMRNRIVPPCSEELAMKRSVNAKLIWQNPEYRARRSIAATGRKHDEATKKKISDAQKNLEYHCRSEVLRGVNKSRTGKTYEELYGPEKAAEIKAKVSVASKRKRGPRKKRGVPAVPNGEGNRNRMSNENY